jgi:hypothetical protein
MPSVPPSMASLLMSTILESYINFDGGNASDELGESTFEESVDWGKQKFYFGLNGNRRMAVQLLKQLNGIKLHWK